MKTFKRRKKTLTKSVLIFAFYKQPASRKITQKNNSESFNLAKKSFLASGPKKSINFELSYVRWIIARATAYDDFTQF